ncbi:P-loop containing nucleoside triphosphate hydrolase protein [Trametes coccinea BRFM310]|uniref:p-loop containing nucleoside triphosphate hydrolase protein n=1 Tax=Trametes coccinea (strain BRFM310) TaxID=1353009 RepID=A0A1Y2IPH0_TRAC3|nr:P-loop containing nucleoside triphosphate hydrolase protein [Trametes coccinea BRFM310]
MLRIPQLIRSQCRHNLSRPVLSAPKIITRARTGKAPSKHKPKPNFQHKGGFRRHDEPREPRIRVSASGVEAYLSENAYDWLDRTLDQTIDRLARMGLPDDDIRPLLKTFVIEMERGTVFKHLAYSEAYLERFAHDLSRGTRKTLDREYTKILFEWANHPEGSKVLESAVPYDVISRMQAIYRAVDLSTMPWMHATTRVAAPRKFIMHVGPTNSGKTHNALRALAAAKRGIYAGPLRLLAYEIWDRLNKGQIVPLGVEPEPEDKPDVHTNFDLGEAATTGQTVVVTRTGNAKYARACNMLTGEERKIVKEHAPLVSCTVEMAPSTEAWDVAVIDEIQLIADPQRGGAWTNAVLGLNAKEIHLCGEESAIPLIESITRDLGDTLEINRYQRLTPLVVAEKSLEGDLSRIEKGDCAVAFSRNGIFGLKGRIEESTKFRCALAYGRLPPEIRSEQAALFNDPQSGYDVLVGSDAIGMGLNLKIKRVVFEAVSKFDGGRMRVLSPSAIKQIAGRAGRYGLHGADSAGGVVTTLHPEDLDIVRKALTASYEPIRYAYIHLTEEYFRKVIQVLPWGATQGTVGEVFQYVAKLPPQFAFQSLESLEMAFQFIDSFLDCLTVEARLAASNAPCPWRDPSAVAGAVSLMEIYRDKLRVSIEAALHRAGLLQKLNEGLLLMESDRPTYDQKTIVSMLSHLETVHKIIVLYLWYSYRYAVAFPEQQKAFQLRLITEFAMEWCLELLHQLRMKTPHPGPAARQQVMTRRPLNLDEPINAVDSEATSTPPHFITLTERKKLVFANPDGEFFSFYIRSGTNRSSYETGKYSRIVVR